MRFFAHIKTRRRNRSNRNYRREISGFFMFKNQVPKGTIYKQTAEAIKRSPSGRLLCSVRLFQSLEKSSVPQFTRQHSNCQPWKRAGSYYASSPSSSHGRFPRSSGLLHPKYRFIAFCFVNYAPLHSAVFASVAPCVLAVALPPAINLNRYANADFNYLFRWSFTFSVAVSRSYPYTFAT